MNKLNSGFTLVEVSIASFLIVILAIGIIGLQKIMADSQVLTFRNFTTVEDVNYSITSISRELRTMRNGQNGAYAFIRGEDNLVSFYSDIDFDGVSELISYYLDGTTFYKSVTEPTGFPMIYPTENAQIRPIAENVQNGGNPVFMYFNEDWPEDTQNNPMPTPASLADVRLIRIFLNIDNYALSTNVSLRMLKDNL